LIKINNNNSENVKNIINKSDKSKEINEVINGDLNKQQEDFRKKLDEKKRRSLLSTSDVMDQVNVLVRIIFLKFYILILSKY